ncbi:hypothetical protein F2P81_021727 [Scophthalmus maximus]|uniref:Uncharacterized protein n=1 Tax=Scophthalmus maximus TaxID=52904 RepID=A0A6A4S631_SCOMX|nr:hypothetical protein F2P81_021727 [Scophthalmus maximus]
MAAASRLFWFFFHLLPWSSVTEPRILHRGGPLVGFQLRTLSSSCGPALTESRLNHVFVFGVRRKRSDLVSGSERTSRRVFVPRGRLTLRPRPSASRALSPQDKHSVFPLCGFYTCRSIKTEWGPLTSVPQSVRGPRGTRVLSGPLIQDVRDVIDQNTDHGEEAARRRLSVREEHQTLKHWASHRKWSPDDGLQAASGDRHQHRTQHRHVTDLSTDTSQTSAQTRHRPQHRHLTDLSTDTSQTSAQTPHRPQHRHVTDLSTDTSQTSAQTRHRPQHRHLTDLSTDTSQTSAQTPHRPQHRHVTDLSTDTSQTSAQTRHRPQHRHLTDLSTDTSQTSAQTPHRPQHRHVTDLSTDTSQTSAQTRHRPQHRHLTDLSTDTSQTSAQTPHRPQHRHVTDLSTDTSQTSAQTRHRPQHRHLTDLSTDTSQTSVQTRHRPQHRHVTDLLQTCSTERAADESEDEYDEKSYST